MEPKTSFESLKLLGYSQAWLDYNVLTDDLLIEQISELRKGIDTNAEHYRYITFKNYLNQKSEMSDDELNKLFHLIESDQDEAMSSAMGIDLLKKKYLTNIQFSIVEVFLKQTFGEQMKKYIDKERKFRE